ncbi:chemotaxis protein [Alicyclobacillus contaminans]|uniref:globin-coupled sensor protein n=1 Tax=Alicyclobacillus contaminans TaxID=392016 RepID=UPI0003FD664C|nr:globin-coupled sensor protein [Alicyclobacillus contaminans]GMA49855.1 chemotaxis protein [Alicyclobacillus contaminans]
MIRIQDPSVLTYLQIVGVTDQDVQILHQHRPFFERIVSQVVERFYEQVHAVERLKEKFMRHGDLERNKRMQSQYFLSLSAGVIDAAYVELRYNIGRVHARIGLQPEDYVGFYRFYTAETIQRIPSIPGIGVEEALTLAAAVVRLALFDMVLTLAQYEADDEARRNAVLRADWLELSDALSHTAMDLAGTSTEFAKHAGVLAESNVETVALAQKLLAHMDMISDINAAVQQISKETNMLGLNAAIEAVRAGDKGRGFRVVAAEIRRLADEAKRSALEISEKLNNLKALIGQIMTHSEAVSGIGQEQAAGAQELAAAVEHIEQLANALKQRTAAL